MKYLKKWDVGQVVHWIAVKIISFTSTTTTAASLVAAPILAATLIAAAVASTIIVTSSIVVASTASTSSHSKGFFIEFEFCITILPKLWEIPLGEKFWRY